MQKVREEALRVSGGQANQGRNPMQQRLCKMGACSGVAAERNSMEVSISGHSEHHREKRLERRPGHEDLERNYVFISAGDGK